MDRDQYTKLEQLPNIGPAIAGDLRLLGISCPQDLKGHDPYVMYDELCRATGGHHDPCILDIFISAVRFMNGEPAQRWWKYTAERKRRLAARGSRQGGVA